MKSLQIPNSDIFIDLDINSFYDLFSVDKLKKIFPNIEKSTITLSKLKEVLQRLDEAYYDKDEPLVEDDVYDALYFAYQWIENEYPSLKKNDSLTANIGGSSDDNFKKVWHKIRMESLQDIFKLEEITKQIEKIEKALSDNAKFSINDELAELDHAYVVEEKIDGLSVSIEYRDGEFFRASTRGDGDYGEDITDNLRVIKSLPSTINTEAKYLELRAEVYMPSKAFFDLNDLRQKEGLSLFANPRNAAAGSLRQLDSSVTAERNLDLFVFNIQQSEGLTFSSHNDSLNYLKKLGFPISPNFKLCKNIKEILDAIFEINSRRSDLTYGIDGAVVKLDDLLLRLQLGSTSKVPRWAFAYKYEAEIAETKLININWQIGRTGVLTPVAVLDEVKLAGTRVSSATLNNAATIKEKDIRLNDFVNIRKAGDIIPEIINVVDYKRNDKSVPYILPNSCPSCQGLLSWDKNGRSLICTNDSCDEKQFRKVLFFASKSALNIMGLGENSLKVFFKNNLIKSIPDIFRLAEHREFIINSDNFPAFKSKKVDKLLKEIDLARSKDLYLYLIGFGISGVGKSVAKLLVKNYHSLEKIINSSLDDLRTINGVGEEIAEAIYEFFHKPKNLNLIDELKSLGCLNLQNESLLSKGQADSMSIADGRYTNNIFKDKKIVITGNLEKFTRNEVGDILETLGAIISSSVSSKTDILISGDDAGSKLNKAIDLGIKIIYKDEFLKILDKYGLLNE